MRLLAFFLAMILMSVFTPRAFAASEFIESHNTVYEVDESGMTTVTDTVSLTNKLSNVYADKYFLSVGFTNISDVTVMGEKGLVPAQVNSTKNQTTINIAFVDKVVQKDKSNNFVVSYKTPDIASRNGAVWEINIPRLEIQNDLGSYVVSLKVPTSFGLAAYITPEPVTKTNLTPSRGVNNQYDFMMDLNGNRSISAVFGTTQYMSFHLSYYLENINPVAQEMTIALPPDTNYQKIWLKSVSPKPLSIKTDIDGNWLAVFKIDASSHQTIVADGIAVLNFLPSPSRETSESLQRYTLATDLWNTKSPRIVDLSESLRTPRSFYQYAVDHLSYDYGKLNSNNVRLGADGVLDRPTSAICTDYSDLFIALSRAAGIPARELEGFAFTSNDKLRPVSLKKDVLHSWPEYFDVSKQSWIYVDPTWESTTGGIDYFNKIDLNHLVFVIHGTSSYLPLPAGAYKQEGKVTKDVEVVAVSAVSLPEPVIEMTTEGKVLKIKNTGEVSISGDLLVTGSTAGIIDYKTYVEILPPQGIVEITLPIDQSKINGKQKIKLRVSFDEKIYDVETTVTALNKTLVVAGIAGASIVLGFAFIQAGGVLLRRRK